MPQDPGTYEHVISVVGASSKMDDYDTKIQARDQQVNGNRAVKKWVDSDSNYNLVNTESSYAKTVNSGANVAVALASTPGGPGPSTPPPSVGPGTHVAHVKTPVTGGGGPVSVAPVVPKAPVDVTSPVLAPVKVKEPVGKVPVTGSPVSGPISGTRTGGDQPVNTGTTAAAGVTDVGASTSSTTGGPSWLNDLLSGDSRNGNSGSNSTVVRSPNGNDAVSNPGSGVNANANAKTNSPLANGGKEGVADLKSATKTPSASSMTAAERAAAGQNGTPGMGGGQRGKNGDKERKTRFVMPEQLFSIEDEDGNIRTPDGKIITDRPVGAATDEELARWKQQQDERQKGLG
jgi:hypothetical protein